MILHDQHQVALTVPVFCAHICLIWQISLRKLTDLQLHFLESECSAHSACMRRFTKAPCDSGLEWMLMMYPWLPAWAPDTARNVGVSTALQHDK